jgi:hypothetical protein
MTKETPYQMSLRRYYDMTNYNPLTHDIDDKLLEVRIKRNKAKHKIQDLMMVRRKYDYTI